MTPESVMSLAYQSIKLALMVVGPLLLIILVVGLVISIFQAATQINEMTLSFIPKLLAVCIALILGGPWLIDQVVDFMRVVLASPATLAF